MTTPTDHIHIKQSMFSQPVKFKIAGSTAKALLLKNFRNIEYWIPIKALTKQEDGFHTIKKWFVDGNKKTAHDLFY